MGEEDLELQWLNLRFKSTWALRSLGLLNTKSTPYPRAKDVRIQLVA